MTCNEVFVFKGVSEMDEFLEVTKRETEYYYGLYNSYLIFQFVLHPKFNERTKYLTTRDDRWSTRS